VSVEAPVTPHTPLDRLKPWLVARLHPLSDYDPLSRTLRSDFDLNPDLDGRKAIHALAPAAVLVPLVERAEGLSVILTRRADSLARHSGQIAFPGGRCDPGETPWATALREAQEEIGLDPAFVAVCGLGDPYETVTGFCVTPVVGFVSPGFTLNAAPAEVAEVFETPFGFLMDPANHERRFHEGLDGQRRRYYAMPYQDRFIWGATAGMLRSLYERLFGEGAEALSPQTPQPAVSDH
jgi:8-oxo-dGTP pyrophosphatase MutT (NUDIX family)